MSLIYLAIAENIEGMPKYRAVCYAPYTSIKEGDVVFLETKINRYQIKEILLLSDNDEVFQFFRKVTDVYRVLSVVRTIEYEEDENDLSN